jgi:ubiquinone/menaquinone biosynthesis C-methylase UbiE
MTTTERLRQVWQLVDFNPLAARNIVTAELLVRAVDVHSGERVLDVAAGTGNTALAAARRDARVTAVDFAPVLLETAARRAEVESLELETRVADAQDLPFPDASFDVVLSSFGAQFATDQRRTAAELVRVCRPGGRIAMANWSKDGLVGRINAATAALGPTPPAAPGPSPLDWGSAEHCRDLFGDRVTAITSTTRIFEFVAASARAHVEFMHRHFGPVRAALEALDPEDRERYTSAVAAELDRVNRATDGTLVAAAEYLELVATVA